MLDLNHLLPLRTLLIWCAFAVIRGIDDAKDGLTESLSPVVCTLRSRASEIAFIFAIAKEGG